jgi:endonuclease/exonuclease/phosphatase family metal-dependent hydrolase
MSKFLYLLLMVAAVGGGWYFYTHYEVAGLGEVTVQPRGAGSQTGGSRADGGGAKPPKQSPGGPQRSTIRIATFNVNPLDHLKLGNRQVASRLVELIRTFDLLAVQNVQAANQGVLIELVEQVNAAGRQYDFAVAHEVTTRPVGQYSAFLFDRATVQVDRSTVYLVKDSEGLLRRPPLVASFQVQGAAPAEAFTFTLVNVHNDANRAASELDVLDDVFRAVRDDGRGEDDVILLGDLGADDRNLGEVGQIPHITWAVSGMPSNLRTSRLADNLLFDRRATAEFTGRAGVTDLMREFSMPMRDVLEISDHFPVWAEFSSYEGGQAGHVAADTR